MRKRESNGRTTTTNPLKATIYEETPRQNLVSVRSVPSDKERAERGRNER